MPARIVTQNLCNTAVYPGFLKRIKRFLYEPGNSFRRATMGNMTEQTFLFHKDVFMPAKFKRPCYEGPLCYGPHARKESLTDKYGLIELPGSFHADGAVLIEAEATVSGKVVKQVWRTRLDETRDLILVITSSGFVKTVWVNLANDLHATLNKAKYVRH